jgi:hypothetical protein
MPFSNAAGPVSDLANSTRGVNGDAAQESGAEANHPGFSAETPSGIDPNSSSSGPLSGRSSSNADTVLSNAAGGPAYESARSAATTPTLSSAGVRVTVSDSIVLMTLSYLNREIVTIQVTAEDREDMQSVVRNLRRSLDGSCPDVQRVEQQLHHLMRRAGTTCVYPENQRSSELWLRLNDELPQGLRQQLYPGLVGAAKGCGNLSVSHVRGIAGALLGEDHVYFLTHGRLSNEMVAAQFTHTTGNVVRVEAMDGIGQRSEWEISAFDNEACGLLGRFLVRCSDDAINLWNLPAGKVYSPFPHRVRASATLGRLGEFGRSLAAQQQNCGANAIETPTVFAIRSIGFPSADSVRAEADVELQGGLARIGVVVDQHGIVEVACSSGHFDPGAKQNQNTLWVRGRAGNNLDKSPQSPKGLAALLATAA